MLGPSQRCRYEPITSIPSQLNVALYTFLTKANKTVQAADDALNMLQKFQGGINQHKLNLQRGVLSGMVQSSDECKDGIECIKQSYLSLYATRSPDSVLSWAGIQYHINKFVSGVNIRDLLKWIDKYGKNMSESLSEGVIKFVGIPMIGLLQYLESDYITYCVPSNASSGLGTRPVDYIYVNGTMTSQKTNKTLDGKERIMEGKQAYARVLSYFTSTNYTPGKYGLFIILKFKLILKNARTIQEVMHSFTAELLIEYGVIR